MNNVENCIQSILIEKEDEAALLQERIAILKKLIAINRNNFDYDAVQLSESFMSGSLKHLDCNPTGQIFQKMVKITSKPDELSVFMHLQVQENFELGFMHLICMNSLGCGIPFQYKICRSQSDKVLLTILFHSPIPTNYSIYFCHQKGDNNDLSQYQLLYQSDV